MISSFSQEQFQQFYEFSGGGGGDNRKVPDCAAQGRPDCFAMGW